MWLIIIPDTFQSDFIKSCSGRLKIFLSKFWNVYFLDFKKIRENCLLLRKHIFYVFDKLTLFLFVHVFLSFLLFYKRQIKELCKVSVHDYCALENIWVYENRNMIKGNIIPIYKLFFSFWILTLKFYLLSCSFPPLNKMKKWFFLKSYLER